MGGMELHHKNIVIVDDEEANIVILKGILQRAGYKQIIAFQDARLFFERFHVIQPDLMLLDFHMPHISGFEVMSWIHEQLPEDAYFPVLMLTADSRTEIKQKALSSGAKDFLTKPYDRTEVLLRIQNLLEARHFHQQLMMQNEWLEKKVKQRTVQLENAQIEMLIRLAKASEYRDDESGEHVWRVARTSALVAQELELDQERVEMILRATRLHDVGKIGIPDGILLKPGKLSDAEYEVVKTHTEVGANLLSGGQSPLIKMAEMIALTHHERWDGTGYPQGLKGDEIPLESRILAVVDTFDAMTHDRAHRRARTLPEAVEEIRAQCGKQFDPEVVNAFIRLYEKGDLITEAEA